MFLAKANEERSRRIGAMSSEQRDIENYLRVDVYCSIQLRPLTVNLDSGFVDGDPLRLRLWRVAAAVSQPMHPVPNRAMRV